jgi:hypothetical protein
MPCQSNGQITKRRTGSRESGGFGMGSFLAAARQRRRLEEEA